MMLATRGRSAEGALAKGARVPNMSPTGAGRAGAFNEAKRDAGIPTSQQPSRTLLNEDLRFNPQLGRIYEFEVPAPGGGTRTIRIRDDAGGTITGQETLKAEALILMIQRRTITTMTIKFSYSDNIIDVNDVINFRSHRDLNGDKLGGATWLEAGMTPYDSLLSVLRFIYGLVIEKSPEYQIRLLIGSSAWQPDTRIVRYHKLWGALRARGIEISHANEESEFLAESNEGIKFFGSIHFSELSLASVAKTLLAEKSAYIVSCPGNFPVKELLETGWRGEIGCDMSIIDKIMINDCLLFKALGEFDDRERGLICLGSPDLLRRFCS